MAKKKGRGRPKGSVNKTKKVVKVKKAGAKRLGRPKGSVNKAAKPKKELVAGSFVDDAFKQEIKTVLIHVLGLFKASLLDAFRQYIEYLLNAGKPASVEDFMAKHSNTIKLHGIDKETLLSALSEVELETLTNSQAQKAVESVKTETTGDQLIAKASKKKKVIAAPSTTQEEAQAAAELPSHAELPDLAPPGEEPVAQVEEPAKTEKTSVFDSLELL